MLQEKRILLSHVFSGCYLLSLNTQDDSKWKANPVYIETGYDKTMLTNFTIYEYRDQYVVNYLAEENFWLY